MLSDLQVGKFDCQCSYCEKDISQTLRIKCAECENFVLCGDCFSVGVELDSHKNTHSYLVNDCLDVSVFTKDWSLAEEFLLLDGIAKLGLGNWRMIGEYIGQRTARQCEEHYWEQYMGVYGHCLPPTFTMKGVTNPTAELAESCCMTCLRIPGEFNIGDKVQRGEVSVSGPSRSVTQKKEQELREKLAQLPGADLAGFMPLREDFDVEYENDAEKMLAEMEFTPDEHESETLLKLRVVRIYNQKLTEREKRKRFAIDRGIVDLKRQLQNEKRRNKEDRDVTMRLRAFARLQTAEESDAMVEGVMQARRLKKQLEVLQSYRSIGCRNVLEAREFEAERKRREHEVRTNKQQRTGEVSGIAAGRRSTARGNTVLTNSVENSNSNISEATEHYRGDLVMRRRSQPAPKMLRNNSSTRVPSNPTLAITYAAAVASLTEGAVSPIPAKYDVITDTSGAPIALDSSPQTREFSTSDDKELMDIEASVPSALPDISDSEISLCAKLGMTSSAYAALKTELVSGTLTTEGIKQHYHKLPNGELLYDFFVECGLQTQRIIDGI